LAKQLTLNPNTVARAYQQLKAEDITLTRRGDGIEVAEGAAEKCIAERKNYFVRRFADFLAEAERSKLPVTELQEIVSQFHNSTCKENQ
jgi:GntR family transcriptional regulator